MKKIVVEIKSNKEIQVEMLRNMLRGLWFNEEFEIEDVSPHTCRLTEAQARDMMTEPEKPEIKKLIIIEDINLDTMRENISAVCNKLNEVIDYLNKQAIKGGK